MKKPGVTDEEIIRLYDSYLVDYSLSFSEVGMMNWGYWDKETVDVSESQINLVNKIFEGNELRNKRVLDVGCGVGGAAVYIQNHFLTDSVVGINISTRQITMANDLAKEKNCSDKVIFLPGNASDIPFPDETFDIITAIECAFHFRDKEKFISEAFRVLKPNGKLIIADVVRTEYHWLEIIFAKELSMFYAGLKTPAPARVSDWRKMFLKNNFSDIFIEDITDHSAISLKQLHKNYMNPAIRKVQAKNEPQSGEKAMGFIKWDRKWYKLLGTLTFWKVIRYVILSAGK